MRLLFDSPEDKRLSSMVTRTCCPGQQALVLQEDIFMCLWGGGCEFLAPSPIGLCKINLQDLLCCQDRFYFIALFSPKINNFVDVAFSNFSGKCKKYAIRTFH